MNDRRSPDQRELNDLSGSAAPTRRTSPLPV